MLFGVVYTHHFYPFSGLIYFFIKISGYDGILGCVTTGTWAIWPKYVHQTISKVLFSIPFLCQMLFILSTEPFLPKQPISDKASYSPIQHLSIQYTFQFHVIDKKTGELILQNKYRMKPQVCFHTINSWEEEINGKQFIVIDLCTADECWNVFELV